MMIIIIVYIYRHIQCIQARNLPIIPTAFFFQESFEVIQQNLWSDAAKASAASAAKSWMLEIQQLDVYGVCIYTLW
jgi:hypothetical protein